MKKITVDAKAFAEAMNKVSRVLKKSALPILEEIAVSVKDGRCTLAATDMDTWLAAELPVCGDDLSFVFQRTKDVMKACAHFEGKLALTLDTEGKKNWKLELHCGQRAATFTAASYEDYPECRTVENDTPMFFYPFSNVYEDDRVCTGNNVLPRYKKLSALKNFPRYLLGLPDNDDMFDRRHNRKELEHKELMELLRDKDPAYYYTDILVPNGRTLSDFINRR